MSDAAMLAIGALAMVMPASGNVVAEIRPHVPVTETAVAPLTFAGRYATSDPWAGSELHVFPDGTYIYAQWGCEEPHSVYDKGTWRLDGSRLSLASDPEVVWDAHLDREFVTIRREAKTDVLLMGTVRAAARFKSMVDRHRQVDPDLILALTALQRTEQYDPSRGSDVKAALLKSAWRPEQFGAGR